MLAGVSPVSVYLSLTMTSRHPRNLFKKKPLRHSARRASGLIALCARGTLRTARIESMRKAGAIDKEITMCGVRSQLHIKVLSGAVIGIFVLQRNGTPPALTLGKGLPTTELISRFTGAVLDSWIMLILGKPVTS